MQARSHPRERHRRLTALSIPFEYAEHDGGHFNLNDRYLEILPGLIERLS